MREAFQRILQSLLGDTFDPEVTVAIISTISVAFTFVGRMAWVGCVWVFENIRYGGWTIIVKNGKSNRNWKTYVDKDIIKNYKNKNYVVFKQNLGTMISGDGNLNFSFGVPIDSTPTLRTPPQALGLTIDEKKKLIEVDFAKVNSNP
jgi:hypothetical protein